MIEPVHQEDAPRASVLLSFPAISEGPRGRHYNTVKRVIDLALAGLLLILLSPILLVVSVAVKLDSTGPVFFVQERVGTRHVRRAGQGYWELTLFNVFKFRSMAHDADESVHERHVEALKNGWAGTGRTIKVPNDGRVTRVGRVLRRTSLDELPQLINVVRGEMSLIGPRPVPPYEVDRLEPGDARRFTVLPGISGLWQVRGRCALPFNEMIACDVEYAAKPTIRQDLAIMVRTVPAVLTGTGAQ